MAILQLVLLSIFGLSSVASAAESSYDYLTVSHAFLNAYLSGNGWLQGALIIVVGFVVASCITWAVYRIIHKISLQTTSLTGTKFARLIRLPLFTTLFVISLTMAVKLMPMVESQQMILERLFQTTGLCVWVYSVISLVSLILARMAEFTDTYICVHNRTLTLFDNGAKVVIFAVAAYFLFIIWNIDLTAWLASAGIVGIAVGFAAKDTLSNLFSGVFILADVPYRVGDYIILSGGDRGKVLQIGLRSTRLLTRDDVEVIIPNSIMGNTTVINQSGGPARHLRVWVKVGVAYGSDVDLVKEILMDVALKEPQVLDSPVPRVRFRAFGASSLDFELLAWVADPELRGRVLDALNTAVYHHFTTKNIEIPYTKQDLYIKEWPERK